MPINHALQSYMILNFVVGHNQSHSVTKLQYVLLSFYVTELTLCFAVPLSRKTLLDCSGHPTLSSRGATVNHNLNMVGQAWSAFIILHHNACDLLMQNTSCTCLLSTMVNTIPVQIICVKCLHYMIVQHYWYMYLAQCDLNWI